MAYALIAHAQELSEQQSLRAPAENQGTYDQQFLQPIVVLPTPTATPGSPWAFAVSRGRTAQYDIVYYAALRHGADPDLMLRVAICESGLKPEAKNTASTASGLFQFLDSTFGSQAAIHGITGEKNDPMVQADLAARMIALGGITHWNASRACWAR